MSDWKRVTKKDKCPVCGHDSWCIYTTDAVICMRVESKFPKTFKTGEKGWLHKERCSQPNLTTTKCATTVAQDSIDCRALISKWDQNTRNRELVYTLARVLGVSPGSLNALECIFAEDHEAWAFPMKDGYENMVGIRLRSLGGDKWAVRGSHAGCFIPAIKAERQALVVEGPTDTAAALDLGYYAVGRPSCSGGGPQIKQLVLRHKIRRAVIVADNDEPGVRGARLLTEMLPVPCAIVILPCKDLRAFVKLGGTREMLDSKIEQSVWLNAQ